MSTKTTYIEDNFIIDIDVHRSTILLIKKKFDLITSLFLDSFAFIYLLFSDCHIVLVYHFNYSGTIAIVFALFY